MPCLLQIDFPYAGPWGDEMTAALENLARNIADEPGLVWKIWTVSEATGEAGGIYLFSDRPSADAYLAMHMVRLRDFGIPVVNSKLFTVNETLSRLDRAPL